MVARDEQNRRERKKQRVKREKKKGPPFCSNIILRNYRRFQRFAVLILDFTNIEEKGREWTCGPTVRGT